MKEKYQKYCKCWSELDAPSLRRALRIDLSKLPKTTGLGKSALCARHQRCLPPELYSKTASHGSQFSDGAAPTARNLSLDKKASRWQVA